ncbi:transposase [Streptomyces sp. NPDC014734]|uniref:transposase n=1 Tax=Streptomyces sp. NPDC014734 TaxID=3364886 RepID=UPI0036F82134
MRKGHVHGTVPVDAETRLPVDLLPNREAGTIAARLAERPGIEVVCRDRASFFAEGAGIGAPTAVQVVGRFHLWHNLGEAAERCISRHRSCLPAIVPACPRPPLILLRRRERLRHRRTAARHGPPGTTSPTSPAPNTPLSVRCRPPATAGARSGAGSA